ncbi:hypothetical protein P9E76_15325 [Schinkia azotoformans]|uniref:hypothetical protein n=1 Tax=Schinkia azotoformans TaxID=1454 RepID=UPI0002F0491F|nr:hypothetical protein [Schinkia azotoformans]MEC1638150.1 hypothetical protein [Schinkia azotoformans]MEC1946416.1 hypothetical protein [Schinkia azotoformans]
MTNKKRRNNPQGGSQKGKPYSEAVSAGDNVMAAEEMEKAINPTRTKMSDG